MSVHAAVSCKRCPPSLPYIIIVQTCGKQWDLPKFVDALSVTLRFSRLLIYIYIYCNYIYIYIVIIYIYIITTLFVGCKHGGRSKNVSNIFDPFLFLSRWGRLYVCMLDPPRSKTEPRKIYIWKGGRKSVIDTSTPPPPVPPLRIGGGR